MPRFLLSAAGVALVVAVAPALAAQQDHTVTAVTNNTFDMPALTIAAGDRVYFANTDTDSGLAGMHNFVFDDGPQYPSMPALANDPVWDTPLSRTFTTPGTYHYVCALHGPTMSGTITVTAAPPPPGGTPTPSPSPSPGPGPGPGGGTTPAGGAPAQLRSLKPAAKSFCARRSATCRKPGVRLKIDLSAPARVHGLLKRKAKRFGSVDFGTVAAGPRTLRFQKTASGKRLKRGRYTLAVTIDGAPAKTLAFRVR